MKCNMALEDYFFGTATVGDRGQVVIPAEARKKLNIQSGDKILVLAHPAGNGIVLCKIDAMREVATEFLAYLEKVASDIDEQNKTNNE